MTALAHASESGASTMGVATTSYMMAWKPKDTLEFLEHCHGLGAGGIQSAITGDPAAIRARAEKYGMYVEAMVPLPENNDSGAFEKAVQNAKAAGATAMRTACLHTRRYETFKSLDAWREHVKQSHAAIEAARPIVEKYKIPLAVENHKDWTADELVDLMKKYGSQYVGVCLDFGNNISLLDEPMSVIEKLAPYATATHVKNMGVEQADDGFLLSEVLLGNGYLDVAHAISLVRRARPEVKFTLEMITRDPLHVPCLSDEYWVTFPDRNGLYLARTLRFVQEHPSINPLPTVAQLTHQQWLAQEDQNVAQCLRYAKQNLGF